MVDDWKKRPKGCKRTLSGRHLPALVVVGTFQVEIRCSACGVIDDMGKFAEYLYPNAPKVNDLGKEPNAKN